MAVKICEKCGESNRENASVCVVCSSSLANAEIRGTLNEEKQYEGSLGNAGKSKSGKYCNNCGERLEPNAITCKYCGKPVTKAPKKNNYYENDTYTTSSESSYMLIGCATLLLAVITFFLPLIGVIVGGIVAFNQDDTKKMIGIGLIIFALLLIFVRIII